MATRPFSSNLASILYAFTITLAFTLAACVHAPAPVAPVAEVELTSVPAKPEFTMNVKDRYRLYVPKSITGAKNGSKKIPRALLVMLHGCAQLPEDIAQITDMNKEAERGGFVVLYPAQAKGRHAMNCWRWFDEANQKPDGHGEIAEVVAMVKEAQKTLQNSTPIDAQKIFVAGLSSGAGLAAELLACYPSVFKGGALHSGPAFGIAKDEETAQHLLTDVRAMAPVANRDCDPHKFGGRVLIIQGGNDLIVHPGHAKDLFDQFTPNPSQAGEQVLGLTIKGQGVIPTRVICRGGPKPKECLMAVSRLGHAWSGGKPGAFSDPRGPSASEMIRRFVIGGELPFTTKVQ